MDCLCAFQTGGSWDFQLDSFIIDRFSEKSIWNAEGLISTLLEVANLHSQELLQIVKKRVEMELFDREALEFLCCKIALFTSDVRVLFKLY